MKFIAELLLRRLTQQMLQLCRAWNSGTSISYSGLKLIPPIHNSPGRLPHVGRKQKKKNLWAHHCARTLPEASNLFSREEAAHMKKSVSMRRLLVAEYLHVNCDQRRFRLRMLENVPCCTPHTVVVIVPTVQSLLDSRAARTIWRSASAAGGA